MAIPTRTNSANLDYHLVDVFTETALKGNGLAVVFDTAGLSTERMQAVAREFNLSETTFIQRRDPSIEKHEGVKVRIFTTQEELPFAGHPTLGTASVLKQFVPEVLEGDTIRLALKVGTVSVRFEQEGLFGEMTQRDPEFGDQLDPAEVAQLCGLRKDDLHATTPPQVVSTGTAFAIVTLRSHEPLARLRVDQESATQYLRKHGGRWF
jgi:trans-2,3-dihydro-3-hydroxyanthranilate isomerase